MPVFSRVQPFVKVQLAVFPLLLLTGIASADSFMSGLSFRDSVAAGSWKYYAVNPDAEASHVDVELLGLSADVDLHVKAGVQPTRSLYDCRPFNSGLTSESCSIPLVSGESGLHIGVYGTEAGRYTLRATINSSTDDHADSIQGATALKTNNALVNGSLAAGDIDFFRVVLPAAGVLTVMSTGSTDTYGRIHDATGQSLAYANGGGTGKNFKLRYQASAAGTYYVSVRHNKSTGTGAYKVKASFAPASANSAFILPFTAGQSWKVCQGYNTPEITHTGSLAHSFDLSIAADSTSSSGYGCLGAPNASAGQNVLAPADAKIAWVSPLTKDIVCLTLDNAAPNNARSIMLGHFSLAAGLGMGSTVKQGAILGKVNVAGSANGNYAHIQISSYATTQCMDSIGVLSNSIPLGTLFGGSYNFTSNGSKHQWYGAGVTR